MTKPSGLQVAESSLRVPGAGRAKRWALNGVAMITPIFLLALLEGGLRWGGYGADYPLFVRSQADSSYLVQNPEVARRYFKRQERVPTSQNDYFKAEKDSATFRVFVQGGSSAAGYPLYYGGSFSRMLEQRLLQTFPGRNIEVINTAMAAVNSYALLDLVGEIIDQKPDLVLIYAGHNEYYGSLGVGSAESLGRFRFVVNLYLRLQHLRIVQALQAGLMRATAVFRPADEEAVAGATLMSRLVREQEIPLGSSIYRLGLDQFAGNMGALLNMYRAQGIPVMIGTLASNERDQPPFVSQLAPETEAPIWNEEMRGAEQALMRGDTAQALVYLDAAIRVDSLAAKPFYVKARIRELQQRYEEAFEAYVEAKDRDQLRFRAPEAVNTLIRQLADEHGAVVVESQERIRRLSPHGIIGHEAMLEHLHPNVEGYFALADAFYEAMRASGTIGSWERAVPAGLARREILFTAVDSLVGAYRVVQLKNSWPFQPAGTVGKMAEVAPENEVERIAYALYRSEISWYEATNRLRAYYESAGDLHNALRAALAVVQEYPFIAPPYLATGDVLMKQGRLSEALNYFEAGNEREPTVTGYRMIAAVNMQRGNAEEAISALQKGLQLEPANEQTLFQLSVAYMLSRQFDQAKGATERLLRVNPTHAEARAMMQRLQNPS